MHSQVTHLIDAARKPNITVQVIPFEVGAHPGMPGSFVHMDFKDPLDPELVYIDTMAGDLFLEADADLRRYRSMFDHLRAAPHTISQHPDHRTRRTKSGPTDSVVFRLFSGATAGSRIVPGASGSLVDDIRDVRIRGPLIMMTGYDALAGSSPGASSAASVIAPVPGALRWAAVLLAGAGLLITMPVPVAADPAGGTERAR
jgi:hypothetical protein